MSASFGVCIPFGLCSYSILTCSLQLAVAENLKATYLLIVWIVPMADWTLKKLTYTISFFMVKHRTQKFRKKPKGLGQSVLPLSGNAEVLKFWHCMTFNIGYTMCYILHWLFLAANRMLIGQQ